jgi:hypothetical protein
MPRRADRGPIAPRITAIFAPPFTDADDLLFAPIPVAVTA